SVKVALITQIVVSVGATRLFDGIGLGAGAARMEVIVVLLEELRLTLLASGSVPVFTDQRSTPHCAHTEAGIHTATTKRNQTLRNIRSLRSAWGHTAQRANIVNELCSCGCNLK